MSDIAALFTWVNMRFLLQGLGMTLLISALAILCSVVLGTVISVMRTSNARVLRGIATVYIEIFKNTPLLLWIMFTFFVAQLPPIGAAVLAFTLFTSASVAEIVRGGLASVPHGQYEAARSQGFSTVQTYVLIILPQALRNMVPALLSQFVTTIKDTSYLWGAMALQELMGRGMIHRADLRHLRHHGAYLLHRVLHAVADRPRLPAQAEGSPRRVGRVARARFPAIPSAARSRRIPLRVIRTAFRRPGPPHATTAAGLCAAKSGFWQHGNELLAEAVGRSGVFPTAWRSGVFLRRSKRANAAKSSILLQIDPWKRARDGICAMRRAVLSRTACLGCRRYCT